MLQGSRIDAADFELAIERLTAGVPATEALDDRFVEAFVVSGTAEDCLAQTALYKNSGVDELVLTFTGTGADEEINYLGVAAARSSFTG